MGTLTQVSTCLVQETSPLLQDLLVTVEDTFLLHPSQETEKRSMFLSNIDQVLSFDVPTLHFFASHKDFPPDVVAKKLRGALEKILVPYDFLAGRMKLNPSNGRMEFECNGGGIVMAVASSKCTLEEIGDLVYPNPAFDKLVSVNHGNHLLEKDEKALCFVQITSFRCGGFAIGISTNHAAFDGLSFKTFLDNLAAVASNNPLPVTPCNDRQLLAARSPPRVTFPHPELLKLDTHLGDTDNNTAPVFEASKELLHFKIFRLTSAHVSALKEKGKAHEDSRVSGFNAVTAHIWRCKALSYDAVENLERVSRILYAVNIRGRVVPPLPASYTGNAVLSAYASATCKELKEEGLGGVVERISEGGKRMSDEYVRSVIDWGEVNKGFPNGEVLVSSWWRLGFEKVEYPWGSPLYSCPLVNHRKDIILLFPDMEEKDGVNVLVALPPHQISKFQQLFHDCLFA